jgi:ubiquinone/menaquinone biosynthesis C-methylase UbiE
VDDRAFSAAQSFLLAAKMYWTTTLYRALRDEFLAQDLSDDAEQSVEEVAAILEDSTLYQYFAWLERHLQRMKYAGRYGLIPYHDERRSELLADISRAVELDPNLEMPNYYTAVDIHQHPGGLWSDETAAWVYERGARGTTPMLGAAHNDLHDRFTDVVAAAGEPKRILDMGGGFGKSTGPLGHRFPDANVESIDLSASCVTLGAHIAKQRQLDNIRYRQMDARHTDYGDEAFDLVTSTMVLHELPPKALEEFFDEAFRVLEPGGRTVHLDFYQIPDGFRRFIHYGHARRNNEPFMQPLASMDLAALLKKKGFIDIQITPFQESEEIDIEKNDAWRFPWTVVTASKPAV